VDLFVSILRSCQPSLFEEEEFIPVRVYFDFNISQPQKHSNMKTSFVILFAVLCISGLSDGLQCHQCTSATHTKCGDPFFFEGEVDEEGKPVPKTLEFLKDCPTDKEYTLCRKIYQNVRGEERIIRGCGHIEYKNPCYTNVQEEYNTYICTCKGDGCNGSTSNGLATGLIATIAVTWGAVKLI